jgi:protein-disulfide isomerase
MSRNVKISAALIALFVVVVAAIAVASGGGDAGDPATETTASSQTTTAAPGANGASGTGTSSALPRVVTDDPRRLGQPGRGGVTFTEFLDFECEACGAVYPAIEELRKRYAGRVTFNIRYFPLPSHQNARNAALAVEAAAQQGKLEPMYKRMFETQSEWGEQRDSEADRFRGFARELGLNLRRFDAAVADPRTSRRVQRDVDAGTALGLRGTPTFFVNEQRIEPQSLEDLQQEIDTALEGS